MASARRLHHLLEGKELATTPADSGAEWNQREISLGKP
jgi:hypothetical protein